MDGRILRERDLEVDLESGGATCKEDRTNKHVSSNGQTNKLIDGDGPLHFDGLLNSSKFGEVADKNVGLLVDKNTEGEEDQQHLNFWLRKHIEEKKKKKNIKMCPKPPRPPKGPILDAADQKLVQDIAEFATRRRAWVQQIKAVKKTRASKSSWSSSLSAMVVTILFCLIIIFQVICSRHQETTSTKVSVEPAISGEEGLISIQLFNASVT
ncbi:hypothetical protein K2173_013146 [Erythroxylum novogranatense]|uniref:Transmembrane protein n=1 Tax=Erythroxylum novogranatense TaxID=1862640 RepID=A0AAV8S4S9_9ROSI|nr:hypothetical protein K2173_013146 [Erythroxylum novogranatense]